MQMDWVLGVLLLWIIFFPWYLLERRKYPVAKTTPELPVAQSTPQLPSPGWYIDPHDPALLRWWDGTRWGEHRRRGET